MKQQPVPRGARPRRGRARAGARRSTPRRCGAEEVALAAALGRVLAEDVRADGRRAGLRPLEHGRLRACAPRTPSAPREEAPVRLRLHAETIATGVAPRGRGRARRRDARSRPAACCRAAPTPSCPSSTPTSEADGALVRAARRARPAAAVSFAGTDMGARRDGALRAARASPRARPACSPRSAARAVACVRRPRVAILSTGDEIVAARRGDAPGPRLRQQRPHPRRRRARARRRARLPRRLPRRRGRAPRARSRRALAARRPGAALGRHLEGRGRPERARRRRSSSRASSCTASR